MVLYCILWYCIVGFGARAVSRKTPIPTLFVIILALRRWAVLGAVLSATKKMTNLKVNVADKIARWRSSPKKYMGQTIIVQKNLRWPKCPIFWVPILSFLHFFSVRAAEGQGSPSAGSNVIKLTSLNVLDTDMYFTYLDCFMVHLLIDFNVFASHLCAVRAPFLAATLIRDIPLFQICSFLTLLKGGGGGVNPC